METAAPSPPPPPPTPQLVYADSVDSSPRSRHTDSWDSPPSSSLPPSSTSSAKLRLMCSYGGHIVPRPHDKYLCYLGGTTRIVVVDRHTSLSSLSTKLSSSLLDNRSFSLKYQLPNEDLDSLISVSTDEDLDNMIEEYDRILASSTHSSSSSSASAAKSSRLRLFLFPPSKPESASSIGSLLDDSKSENWFVDALNGSGVLPRGLSADSADVNCLLGLDDDAAAVGAGSNSKPTHLPDSPSGKPGKLGQEIQSVPDSPMMETTSSFGSTSSASCLSNLPPIRVHVDEGGVRSQDPRSGLEEHFAQMNVGGGALTTISPNTDNPSRVFSDDDRLEQGMLGMVRKFPQPPSQLQQKPNTVEFPTDAVTRENSNPASVFSRQKAGYYQDQVVSLPIQERASATATVLDPKRDVSDSNYRIQMQVQDQGYVLPMQQQEQQQFIHAPPHYIHHHATGPIPISSYYHMHPQQHHPQLQQQHQQHQQHQQQQQHRIDQQYPMYFLPVGQNQAYNLAMQSNLGDPSSIRPTQLSNPSIIPAAYKDHAPGYPARSAPPPKPDLSANLYRTATPASAQPLPTAAPPLIHVSDQQQQQYMGYHQLHHPSQSAAAANFTYEFADPLHAQIYYTQQTSTTLAPQYQTVSSGAMPPQTTADAKLNRTSQPL